MAKEKVKKPSELEAIIGKKAFDKMGNYKEATGGGTPIPKGEKLADHPEAKRVMQPRDEDGRFTYNAVNFKELKTKESRGTTVPPFLRGVKINFAAKKKDVWWYNDKRYTVDLGDLTKTEFIETFQVYKGKLQDGSMVFSGAGKGKEVALKSEIQAKPGAYSKQELVSKGQGDATNTNYDPTSMSSQQFGYYFNNASAYYKGRQAKAKPTYAKKNPQKINPYQKPDTSSDSAQKFNFKSAFNKGDGKSVFLALPKDIRKEMVKQGLNKSGAMKKFMKVAVNKQKITDMDDFSNFMRRMLNINTNN